MNLEEIMVIDRILMNIPWLFFPIIISTSARKADPTAVDSQSLHMVKLYQEPFPRL